MRKVACNKFKKSLIEIHSHKQAWSVKKTKKQPYCSYLILERFEDISKAKKLTARKPKKNGNGWKTLKSARNTHGSEINGLVCAFSVCQIKSKL